MKKLVLILLAVGAAAAIAGRNPSPTQPAAEVYGPPAPRVLTTRDIALAALEKIKPVKMNWHMGGFGTVMVADITVTNGNPFDVKDLKFRCATAGASGTDLSTLDKVVYETVPAGKTKTFPKVSIGFVNSQSARAGCEVFDFAPILG